MPRWMGELVWQEWKHNAVAVQCSSRAVAVGKIPGNGLARSLFHCFLPFVWIRPK